MNGNPVVVFFFAAGQAGNGPCEALRRFRCDDQIRIAGTCREIRPVRALELTLCANWSHRGFRLREPSRRSPDIAAHTINIGYQRGGVQ
jgi:hypothetical protein